MKSLEEISKLIEEAREILKKISDGHMGAEATHSRVRNILSIAEQELKFHELDKADKASEQLIEVVRTLETTARILKSAMIKAELFASAQETQTKTMTFWTKVMARATIAVAVATIIYTITSFFQWNILSKQFELARVDQRAWVGVKDIIPQSLQAGQPFTIGIKITNTGKTPAFNLTAQWTISHGPKLLDVDKFVKSINYSSQISKGLIYPNSEGAIPAITSYNLTDEQIRAIKAGEKIVYTLGTIKYEDIFGDLHTTNYCAFYEPGLNAFSFCNQHNNAN